METLIFVRARLQPRRKRCKIIAALQLAKKFGFLGGRSFSSDIKFCPSSGALAPEARF